MAFSDKNASAGIIYLAMETLLVRAMMYTQEIWRSSTRLFETRYAKEMGQLYVHVANKYTQSFLIDYFKKMLKYVSSYIMRGRVLRHLNKLTFLP